MRLAANIGTRMTVRYAFSLLSAGAPTSEPLWQPAFENSPGLSSMRPTGRGLFRSAKARASDVADPSEAADRLRPSKGGDRQEGDVIELFGRKPFGDGAAAVGVGRALAIAADRKRQID